MNRTATHTTHRLLIDAGNTRIKWQCAPVESDEAPVLQGQLTHRALSTDALSQQLHAAWKQLPACQSIWFCNVAGDTLAQTITRILQQQQPHAPLHTVTASQPTTDLINSYTQPATLGSDRWVQAIAAHQRYPHEHLLIVSAGTATTIDAIITGQPAHFIGGVILPGLSTMLQSLATHTAQLPTLQISDTHAFTPFATDTHSAMLNGCLQAQIGAIERSCAALQTHSSEQSSIHIILTGGASTLLQDHITAPVTLANTLVLDGLRYIAESLTNDLRTHHLQG